MMWMRDVETLWPMLNFCAVCAVRAIIFFFFNSKVGGWVDGWMGGWLCVCAGWNRRVGPNSVNHTTLKIVSQSSCVLFGEPQNFLVI
jgi:hypothetical protein